MTLKKIKPAVGIQKRPPPPDACVKNTSTVAIMVTCFHRDIVI
jgi:hypothetical protein